MNISFVDQFVASVHSHHEDQVVVVAHDQDHEGNRTRVVVVVELEEHYGGLCQDVDCRHCDEYFEPLRLEFVVLTKSEEISKNVEHAGSKQES